MRTFAQKQHQPQGRVSSNLARSGTATPGPHHRAPLIPHSQRTIGNRAAQRPSRQAEPDGLEAPSGTQEATRFGHDFGRIPVYSEAPTKIRAKLAVNTPGNSYEQEADRLSDRVMRMPEPQPRRACACGGECPECRQAEQPRHEHERLRTKRVGPGDLGRTAVPPPIVHEVLRSPGRHLDPATRAFMEPRFGVDFGAVRVHTDVRAQRLSADLHADAFTLGNDIFFAADRWHPEAASGRRLIAHELAHTVQQSRGPLAIQRFVSCTRARMSLEECPKRDPGEERDSLREPMIVEFIDAPEVGYVVGNFGVGQSALKASAKTHPNWPKLVQTVSEPGSQWELRGLSDCQGDQQQNELLRQQRADAVRAALPPAAAQRIVGASGVPLHDCITDNTTRLDRAWNRSVLIAWVLGQIKFSPTKVQGTRPVPKPVDQPTADCSDSQEKEVAQAQPIAVDMVRRALYVLRNQDDPAVDQLLRKYFNDDSATTYKRVRAGLSNTLAGLRSNVKLECESKGSFAYDWKRFCGSSSGSVRTAYVRHKHVALRVHLCEAAFGRGDLDLAATLVHEFSHLFDGTVDKRYCWKDCSTLDPEEAYDNADSYAEFANDAFLYFMRTRSP